jgi:ElaB/YqjD/DUF883 family membrane-anchored ribosome-binding protein
MDNTNIETELIKANITDVIISQMRDTYMKLVVKDTEDAIGYEVVSSARKDVKSFRVKVEKILKEIRRPAFEFQKSVVAKEKEIVAKVSEVEDYLTLQELIFKPKEEVIIEPLTDEQKLDKYIKQIQAVVVPVMDTDEGKKNLEKVVKILAKLA